MNVLVVDIGGTHVKVLANDQTESRQFNFGPALLPKPMALGSQEIAEGWSYGVVSIGYPGPVLRNRPIAEPHNLGCCWVP
jgi:polyphosphate glucokinase